MTNEERNTALYQKMFAEQGENVGFIGFQYL